MVENHTHYNSAAYRFVVATNDTSHERRRHVRLLRKAQRVLLILHIPTLVKVQAEVLLWHKEICILVENVFLICAILILHVLFLMST